VDDESAGGYEMLEQSDLSRGAIVLFVSGDSWFSPNFEIEEYNSRDLTMTELDWSRKRPLDGDV